MIDGERIRQLRVSGGYTREQFAEMVGVSNTQAYKYESGKSDATGEIIKRMATLFDVTTDYILGMSDKPNGDSEEFTDRQIRIINRMMDDRIKELKETILRTSAETP